MNEENRIVSLVAERSEKVNELFTAISAAQGMVGDVPKDKKNPYFDSTYASLEGVLKMARPALTKHGLAVVVLPEGADVAVYVTHKSGQFIKSTTSIAGGSGKNVLQQLGSALTYMRRYAICGTLQIGSDEDLDGNEPKAKTADEQKAIREKAEAAVKKSGKTEVFTKTLTAPMVKKLKAIMDEQKMKPADVIKEAVSIFGGQVADEGINKKQYVELVEHLTKKKEAAK